MIVLLLVACLTINTSNFLSLALFLDLRCEMSQLCFSVLVHTQRLQGKNICDIGIKKDDTGNIALLTTAHAVICTARATYVHISLPTITYLHVLGPSYCESGA